MEQRPPPPAPPGRPRRRARVGAAGWIFALTFLLIFAVAGAIALFAVGGAVEEGLLETEAVPAGPAPIAATAVQGLERGSLLREDELEKAIRKLRAAEIGGFVSLRVDADSVDTQMKTRAGELVFVSLAAGGEVRRPTTTSKGFGHIETLPPSAIDPAAPERMIRAATKRSEKSAAQADYLVLLDLGEPTWGLFFKDGSHYQADAAGRALRKVG